MAKQTKADLQKEVATLQQQIDQLSKRRGDLQTEHDRINASIKTQTKAIGAMLLEGRDATKDSQTRERDLIQAEVLIEAISQADDRLRNLNHQHADKQRALVKIDFDQIADQAYDQFLICLDQLSVAASGLDKLRETLIELNRIGAPAEFKLENDDYLRILNQAVGYLRGEYSPMDAVDYKIKQVESSYPTLLALARGRKKS